MPRLQGDPLRVQRKDLTSLSVAGPRFLTANPEALESASAVERRLSRARGCLLGLACGDALGMPIEGSPPPVAPVRD